MATLRWIWLGTVTSADLVPASENNGGSQPDVVHRIEPTPLPSVERLEQLLVKLELDRIDVDHSEREQFRSRLGAFSDVFALDSSELGSTELVTHTIDTSDYVGRPVRQLARQTPFTLRTKVDQLVKEMLYQKVVEPSSSLWACPIVLKDGGVRFCVDY